MNESSQAGIALGFFVSRPLSAVMRLYVFGRLGKIAALFGGA